MSRNKREFFIMQNIVIFQWRTGWGQQLYDATQRQITTRPAVFFSRERHFNYSWAEYTFKRYYAWADHSLKVVIFRRSRGGLLDKNWKGRKKMHLIMIKIASALPIVVAKCSLKLANKIEFWETGVRITEILEKNWEITRFVDLASLRNTV